MPNKSLNLDDTLYNYLLSVSLRESPELAGLRAVTATHALAPMQTAPEQTQFLALLVKLLNARRVIEVGVFTGYSTLAMAQALPVDGRIVACDISDEYAAIGRPFWENAGVNDKIDLRLAPALDTLQALLAEHGAGSFDFAYIDADKPNYGGYYEACLRLVRPGGLIAIDNVLWSGRVAEPATDEHTQALQQLNQKLFDDQRIDLSLLPIGDGLSLARVRDWQPE